MAGVSSWAEYGAITGGTQDRIFNEKHGCTTQPSCRMYAYGRHDPIYYSWRNSGCAPKEPGDAYDAQQSRSFKPLCYGVKDEFPLISWQEAETQVWDARNDITNPNCKDCKSEPCCTWTYISEPPAPTAAPTVAPTYGCLAADFNCSTAVFNKPTLVELVVKGTAVCQTMAWHSDPERATQGRFTVEIEPTTATNDGYWKPSQFTVAGQAYCFPVQDIHHLARNSSSGTPSLVFEPETLKCDTDRAAELMDEFNQLFPAGTLIETRKNCQEV